MYWPGSSRGRPIKKTRLQMAVGLNYETFKRYFNWMGEKGLVSLTVEDDGSEHVQLTRKEFDSYDTMVPDEIWLAGFLIIYIFLIRDT